MSDGSFYMFAEEYVQFMLGIPPGQKLDPSWTVQFDQLYQSHQESKATGNPTTITLGTYKTIELPPGIAVHRLRSVLWVEWSETFHIWRVFLTKGTNAKYSNVESWTEEAIEQNLGIPGGAAITQKLLEAFDLLF